MTSDKAQISLYQQSKAGLKSLFFQTAQVSIGWGLMLILTAGNPPGWLVSASFFIGIIFVVWRESKKQLEPEKKDEKVFQIPKLTERVEYPNQRRMPKKSHAKVNPHGANLSSANLSGANLRSAEVTNTKFGYNRGINEKIKISLIDRGAKFIDAPENKVLG